MSHKIETPNYKNCFRCGDRISNPFSSHKVCDDCSTELQQMSFDGEELLDMITAIIPPAPPTKNMMIPVMTVARVIRKVLIQEGLVLQDDDEDDQPPSKKSRILIS